MTTCTTFNKFHIDLSEMYSTRDTMRIAGPAVFAVATIASEAVSMMTYWVLSGNYLGISFSITVPSGIVFPEAFAMKSAGCTKVHLKMSGYFPVDRLSGFSNETCKTTECSVNSFIATEKLIRSAKAALSDPRITSKFKKLSRSISVARFRLYVSSL